jgi:hypothetical protein
LLQTVYGRGQSESVERPARQGYLLKLRSDRSWLVSSGERARVRGAFDDVDGEASAPHALV